MSREIRLQIVSRGNRSRYATYAENQVAKQFDVSRSPVRDAFKLLQTDQLIQLERMGAKVLQFGDQEKKNSMIYV